MQLFCQNMFCTSATESKISSFFDQAAYGVAIFSLRREVKKEKLSLGRKLYEFGSRVINKMYTYLAGKSTYIK